jgi:hypothetical protein
VPIRDKSPGLRMQPRFPLGKKSSFVALLLLNEDEV